MFQPSDFSQHPLTLAINYVVFELQANYWYEAQQRYGGTSKTPMRYTDARANYLAKLGHENLLKLDDKQYVIACNMYHDAYKRGNTTFNYPEYPVMY